MTVYDAKLSGRKNPHLQVLTGDSSELSIQAGFAQAVDRFGPVHVLIVNPGTADYDCPIWDLPAHVWEKTHDGNTSAFLAIKHFLRAARKCQQELGIELDNLAIVVVGSGNGKTGQYELVHDLKDEVMLLNSGARINAIVPESTTHQGRLDVARSTTFLVSNRTAHITGQCLNVHEATSALNTSTQMQIPRPLTKRNKVRVAISIDLDAVSGWLGTGYHPDNVLADYSAGFFAARVGVPRLLRMLDKLNIASKCTWFIPGHSAESFPDEVKQVVDSGCEIGLHGYAHESAYQLTPQQERDILIRCIEIATKLTGKRPVGYRAPLYQLRESTLDLLEEFGFEYGIPLLPPPSSLLSSNPTASQRASEPANKLK